jgi:hypothetical protein
MAVEKSAAIVTVFDAATMNKAGRKAVAKWIRGQADNLERFAGVFAKRHTARYLYTQKETK